MTGAPPEIASVREFEHFRRSHGFSRAAARRVALHGFKDSDEIDDAEVAARLQGLAAALGFSVITTAQSDATLISVSTERPNK